MYSLTVKPFLVPQPQFASSSSSSTSSSSSSSSHCSHRWSSVINFPMIRTKHSGGRRFALTIHAYDSSKNQAPNGSGDSKPPNGAMVSLSLSLSLCRYTFYTYLCMSVLFDLCFCTFFVNLCEWKNYGGFHGLYRIMLVIKVVISNDGIIY